MLSTLSMREAAQALGISRASAYKLARSGVIPAIRLGGVWRIPLPALEALLRDPSQRAASVMAGQEVRDADGF